jgi:hypothetical protein
MLFATTAGFEQDEALGSLYFFFAESLALAMLDGEIIRLAIQEFECGEDFGQVFLDLPVERQNILERREGQDHITRGLGCWWGEYGDTGYDPECSLCTDEELFEVVA